MISYLLPYDWIDNPKNTIDAKWGYLPKKGNYTLIDDLTLPTPPQEEINTRDRKAYYEYQGARERAFIFYGTDGYVKKFEHDSKGNTRFFASALDAVNYLATKGWLLDKTFKSRSIARGYGDYYIFEHWIMAREIEE